ncbi:hypothetical protein BpHYR1_037105 [Brachionus plicatilis]|uniref:Uncharacterized protein n=1 Tax=Brachionus plicatilis TaxID=10195 RepID=A0A3M7SSB7_BRAPC|nr:hypothetical protein BpHYR1_037105 [Brachionus plicatilis]
MEPSLPRKQTLKPDPSFSIEYVVTPDKHRLKIQCSGWCIVKFKAVSYMQKLFWILASTFMKSAHEYLLTWLGKTIRIRSLSSKFETIPSFSPRVCFNSSKTKSQSAYFCQYFSFLNSS